MDLPDCNPLVCSFIQFKSERSLDVLRELVKVPSGDLHTCQHLEGCIENINADQPDNPLEHLHSYCHLTSVQSMYQVIYAHIESEC